MEKIYIGFSKPNKFKLGAKAISCWMGVEYSHVYIRFDSKTIQSTVYHAAHGMVHFRELESFKNDNIIVKEYELDVTPEIRLNILRHCISISGEGYGYCELLKIAISDVVFKLFNKQLPFNNSKGYICSELVGLICQNEFNINFDTPLFLLKPVHIDKKLNDLNYLQNNNI